MRCCAGCSNRDVFALGTRESREKGLVSAAEYFASYMTTISYICVPTFGVFFLCFSLFCGHKAILDVMVGTTLRQISV